MHDAKCSGVSGIFEIFQLDHTLEHQLAFVIPSDPHF